MTSKKEVTIGITVNLENYENLRLEVEGDVETREDVDDLITFLDGMLARFGRGDPATAERVDAYRRRVLAARPAGPQTPTAGSVPDEKATGPAAPATPGTEPAHRQKENACPSPGTIETAIPPAPEHTEPPRTPEPPAKPEIVPEPEPEQAPPVQVPPHQEPVAAKPPATPGEGVCEMCGAEVTKSQAKLSQLFMSKTLCKKCMEQP
ncbi:hypothetical protein [Methanoculleus sp.]|uniref:hypothetical protein n=1 Tax=Methanoculleus sp. TaxID=90427 RepID=UPI002618BDAA|nr:hypothetical protein [Methanoculleus sp.]MCK9297364.1 hypothetical protein [Methanoculleus sp.]MDD2253372.1 hypothetical protein [Methanoculleus sp.]MDD2787006.1 hypothetical protein [Methanoculleus sp.]MDD3216376.1 hypothetical protein [Methanoculleus sp.]MDD4314360.1 hypothetical protein [Methanoculleus sp.]